MTDAIFCPNCPGGLLVAPGKTCACGFEHSIRPDASTPETDAELAALYPELESVPECSGCGAVNDCGLPLPSSGRCRGCQRVYDLEHQAPTDTRSVALRVIDEELAQLTDHRNYRQEQVDRAREALLEQMERFAAVDGRFQALHKAKRALEAQEGSE